MNIRATKNLIVWSNPRCVDTVRELYKDDSILCYTYTNEFSASS